MNLAIFDLDNTLIGGDSDSLWGQYLADSGIVDSEVYARENLRFYHEYESGTLDILEFLRFSLKPLADNPLQEMLDLRKQFITDKINPIMLPKATELLQKHRQQGHEILIITATNRFITEPIAEMLGVDELIATEAEMINGRYTGEVVGTPSFREGKIEHLNVWLKKKGYNLASSWFYSDSHNDLPLLEMVTHPIAVDADETLAQHAETKGWPSISLRG